MSHGKLLTDSRLIQRNPMRAAVFVACLLASSGVAIELLGQEPAGNPTSDPASQPPPKLSLDDLNRLAEERSNWVNGRPPEMTFPLDAKAVFKVQDQWAFYLKRPKIVTNSVGMNLALIPPGQFVMGSIRPNSPDGPAHDVTISRPFYIGIYEVTQAEYEKVIGYNPSDFATGGRNAAQVVGLDTSRFPVENVYYTGAISFCRRLSERPEEKQAGRVYRLPTEAEWEYTCRAGTEESFHFGRSCNGKNANVKGIVPCPLDSPIGPYLGRTTQVGSYKPNAFGLYDMHGNVCEMCSDWFDEDYYRISPKIDPQGPKNGGNERVIRGGAYAWGAGGCASEHRFPYAVDWHLYGRGFRVVCEIRDLKGETKEDAN